MVDIGTWIDLEKKYLIYGTALLGRFFCDKICEAYGEDTVIGFIESERSNEPFDGGKPVFLPGEAFEAYGEDAYVIVSGVKSAEIMQQRLLDEGFSRERIITPEGYSPYFQSGFKNVLRKVVFYPAIGHEDRDVISKINWFIPDRVKVGLLSQDKGINRVPFGKNVNIQRSRDKYEREIEEADLILLWDVGREDDIVLRFPNKIRVVDRDFYLTIDSDNYDHIFFDSFTPNEKNEYISESKDIFEEMSQVAKSYKRANVFCSGPSLSEIYDRLNEYRNDFNIVCNSMVKDKELIESLRPKLLTFADTDFFMSPGKYCERFYGDLIDAFKKQNFYIAVREHQKPLIEYHYPELKGHIIGLPYSYEKDLWFISKDRFYLKPMANIMTDMMLPLASSMFDNIGIAGCTGRKVDETYFWEHGERVQYLDLKPIVFEMWRGFFHKRRYGDYFNMHCSCVDKLIRYGEKLGKTYGNMTSTYIPTLQIRGSLKVSIITACKNSVATIERTIKSVLGQSYRNLEYIIIDGASEDGTVEQIKKHSNKAILFISEPDDGMYAAMNKGIEKASGDVIGIINSDDWYEKDAVRLAVQTFFLTRADIVYGHQNMVHEEGRKARTPCKGVENLWHGMPFGHPTVFVKREVYEKYGLFDTRWRIVADHELMLRFYSGGAKFAQCDEVLADFSLGGISSRERQGVMQEARDLMLKYADKAPDPYTEKKKIKEEYESAMAEAQLIEATKPMVKEIKKLLMDQKGDVFVFGTGFWGGWIYKLLDKSDLPVKAFIDNNPEYQKMQLFGHNVYSPEKLKVGNAVVFIASVEFQDEIAGQLKDYHNEDLRIIKFSEIKDMGMKIFFETKHEEIK